MNNDFICKSLESTICSLSCWLQIGEEALLSFLMNDIENHYENSDESKEMDICDYMVKQILLQTTPRRELPRVHWFHGTRCLEPIDFQKGLLPMPEMLPQLTDMIHKLAAKEGISPMETQTDEGRHHGFLMSLKRDDPVSRGPFAMLNMEALTNPVQFGCHDYLSMSEIIEDIAIANFGQRSSDLLRAYYLISRPIIIEFWTYPNEQNNPSIEAIIGTSLLYTYAKLHPEKDLLGLFCNTCYSGCGKAIPSEQIVEIISL